MRRRSIGLGLSLTATLCTTAWAIGCVRSEEPGETSKAVEQRMRDFEKRMRDSSPKTQRLALAQPVDPAVVQKAQADLRVLHEYLDDPPSGKIDAVTVNAIEAFQRRVGLRDDGLLSDETVRKLDEAARSAPATTATGRRPG